MSIDKESFSFVGAELAALKDENSKLRAEVHALRDKISKIYNALNSIEEMTRILAANSLLTNLEKKLPPKVSDATQTNKPKPARKKIAVFGNIREDLDDFIAIVERRNLPVDFTNSSAELAVFVARYDFSRQRVDLNFVQRFVNRYEKILIVVEDSPLFVRECYWETLSYEEDFQCSLRISNLDKYKNKILVVDVNLSEALEAQRTNDSALFLRSNFPEVEKFFA